MAPVWTVITEFVEPTCDAYVRRNDHSIHAGSVIIRLDFYVVAFPISRKLHDELYGFANPIDGLIFRERKFVPGRPVEFVRRLS